MTTEQTTNEFIITYGSGVTEHVWTDAQSVEDQVNRTFGLTVEQAAEHGCSVQLVPTAEEQQRLDAEEAERQQLAKEAALKEADEREAKREAAIEEDQGQPAEAPAEAPAPAPRKKR